MINSDLTYYDENVVYPSFYSKMMPSASIAYNIDEILNMYNITYTSDKVVAIIPIGARKSGSNTLYPAIFDGTYIRCNAVDGAELYTYIFHYRTV